MMREPSDGGIPVLTDAVSELDQAEPRYPTDREALIAELQTRLAAATFTLVEESTRAAFAELEAHLLEQVSGRLRESLPELIDSILREHLGEDGSPD